MNASNTDPVRVNQIDWLKIFPSLHLLKAARLGVRVRVLVPALIAVACWKLDFLNAPRAHWGDVDFSWRRFSGLEIFPAPITVIIDMLTGGLGSGYFVLQFPLMLIPLLALMLSATSISRSAAMEFCGSGRVGAISGLNYSVRRSASTLSAFGLAVLIVSLCFIPLSLIGPVASVLGKLPGVLMWVLSVPFTLLGVLAVVVCFVGWLLAFGAIGTDKCGGADALSRGINYTLSHKLITIWYLWFSGAISFVMMFVARVFVYAGMRILERTYPGDAPRSSDVSASLIEVVTSILASLPSAVHLGTFICGVTISYVLLRQREDGIEMAEIDGGQHLFVAGAAKKPAE